ncbi:MAG: Xaa-Pro peptidase family protein [Peptoniphilaceae bacterium]|nr:Xaa-Pro peptidase family protein [Peptoniphilaceae bacterium]MDY6018775.1 Xaa-Pro peptidase family protein [Anaerococcus sp.]
MNRDRINRVIEKMKENSLGQMIISDPYAIFYLTGNLIDPGERLLAFYLNDKGSAKLFVNELFPQEISSDFEIIYYNDIEDGVKIIAKAIGNDRLIGIDKKWPAMFLLSLQEIFPEKKYVNASFIVDQVRSIKDKEERRLMRESSQINDKVMADIVKLVSKGYTEIELGEKLKELYKKYGASDFSFSPITAYGKNGADPHHVTDKTKGKRGDSVVIDIGGLYKGYCSDMTRTVFIGEVSDKKREVYEIVKEANLRGIAAAKPGNRMSDVDKQARSYIEEKGYGKYFTHRTGHSIGIEAHEAGDVSAVNDDIIRPGQIFSVEPGIYLPDDDFGVRIEDLVLVNEDGNEVLNSYTKDLLVIE